MDLTKMIPMDRNCAAELDLWTLQDFLGEAYSRVGGTPDPVAHRRELTRLESICAVLRETSQMPDSKSSKRVLGSLMIALRQMLAAASLGLVGINIPLAGGEPVWLLPAAMTESIGASPDTHVIGSIQGWIRLAAFIRMRRKGLLQDVKMATLFNWTSAYRSEALEEASLKPISVDLTDDSSGLTGGGTRSGTVAKLENFGRLLRDIDAAVRTQTEADFNGWTDEVQDGAELVRWIYDQTVPAKIAAETAVQAARIALEVLTTRFGQGSRGVVFGSEENDVRFVAAEPTFGIAVPSGAVSVGHFAAWYRLAELVLLQLRLGNDAGTIRKALLSDGGRKLLKKGSLTSRALRAIAGRPQQRTKV
jgi:hypothetical protein